MRDMGGEGPRKIADHALQTLEECGRRSGGGYLNLLCDGDVPFCLKNWYP